MEIQQENTHLSTDLQPQKALLQMVSGYWVSQALYVAAKLGIADLLKDGSKCCDELARATQVNAQALYRLMRGLASLGVFAESEPGHFTLTPLAACLQSDVPGSLRGIVLMGGGEYYQAWGNFFYSIQTGKSAFEDLYGMPLFEYYAQNPESGKMYDEAQKSGSSAARTAILKIYDFSGIRRLVDVGGGNGSLLTSILIANPTMQGVLFEQASVIAEAKDLIEVEGASKRCELVAGDFFESVPSGGDAYILRYILHNWDDEGAIAILKNCHHAMVENGKILVIEQVIPPGNEPFIGKLLDLHMLVLFPGGRERTENEYRALFEASDFQLTKIVPTKANVSVIEGIRV